MASRFLGLGNGSDGVIALGSYTPLKYTCSGTSAASSLTATGTFSAGDRLFIHQSRGTGVGYYEDNRVASYTTGTITLVHPLEHTYIDSGSSQAQVLVVKEASAVTGTLTAPAWDGDKGGLFVIACNGVFSGTINGTGKGFRGGASISADGTNKDGQQGEGSVAAGGTASVNANGNGGGGGSKWNPSEGVGSASPGGGGGHAAVGGTGADGGAVTYARGGLAVGDATIATLFLGGGSGSGGVRSTFTGESSGAGAIGGAAIVVYAKTITSAASLVANGNQGSNSSRDGIGAGGGGAGGSILIKSVTSDVSGTITADGAIGGIGGNSNAVRGGTGSTGRVRIESCSLSGTTSPTASTDTGGHAYCGGGAFIF